jgi:ribulose 1,5-bisphosphate synthetase/thiazole synthase
VFSSSKKKYKIFSNTSFYSFFQIIHSMKIIIVGAGPCGLGAAWRAEEVIRQGGSHFD